MKSRQFCSVCKGWLDMSVVPTNDGDEDDGVIWFRCPQCQGFLPKLSGGDQESDRPESAGTTVEPAAADSDGDTSAGSDMPWDSPADMMAAQTPAKEGGTRKFGTQDSGTEDSGTEQSAGAVGAEPASPFLPEDDEAGAGEPAAGVAVESAGQKSDQARDDDGEQSPPEPVHEYAAMLAAADTATSTPYRPWASYEIGQCVHHLAWDDCGVVVDKEDLPGGRKIIKCYFESAGVVRLIEQAPR